jgi:hypothetical protein
MLYLSFLHLLLSGLFLVFLFVLGFIGYLLLTVLLS